MVSHVDEIKSGIRFEFGENWRRFLSQMNDERIALAETSLRTMLGRTSLAGLSFLDIGSGSGLFSLAARRLGAKVRSLDYDPQSVACTRELKRRGFPDDENWTVEEGSVLDAGYMSSLGRYDIVYSWGVLHHTGAMWQACENVAPLLNPGGQLFIALYNDQGSGSRRWLATKRAYNRVPRALKWGILLLASIRLRGLSLLRDTLRGDPTRSWREYSRRSARGMTVWRDIVDWVGGLPFEVARPEEVFDFFRDRGFALERMTTCGAGHGCNEFVFRKERI